jgi:hypothetical protein
MKAEALIKLPSEKKRIRQEGMDLIGEGIA